jgi:hypothetical protein
MTVIHAAFGKSLPAQLAEILGMSEDEMRRQQIHLYICDAVAWLDGVDLNDSAAVYRELEHVRDVHPCFIEAAQFATRASRRRKRSSNPAYWDALDRQRGDADE